jgi:AcrR family transcriptional regulator
VALDPAAADRPRRRRPATRKGRPTLTADLIAKAMLELAGRMGFRAVTMRVLAEHLGVTVRALYNYVEDRQEVVDRAAQLFIASRPEPRLDARDWEGSLADYCRTLRATYRRHPRALLVSLDEEVRDTGIHPNRLLHTEALLGMLRTIGLDLPAALLVHQDVALRVFGFVLLLDYRNDLGEPVMAHTPVPRGWLDAHPDLALPHLREAVSAAPLMTVDEAFEHHTEAVIETVRRFLPSNDSDERRARRLGSDERAARRNGAGC